jgi:CobQ-like glutamine amidotransferase family enzyme
MRDLAGAKAVALRARIEDGVPGVFTCGSLQLLGNYYEPAEGKRIEGLGVLDLWTAHPGPDAQRCIGNMIFEVTPQVLLSDLAPWAPSPLLAVGFENHGGRTFLGRVEPLGRVRRGFGNNGQDGTEGAFYRHSMATYSHGPLLPKNPFLADWLIQTALREKYGANFHLDPVNDRIAEQARATMFERLRVRAPAPPLEREKAA